MATTPRKTQTPGAKKETTTTAQTSTDDVMDAVLGKSKESDVVEDTQPVDPVQTQQSAEDVLADILSGEDLGQEEAPEGFISLEQFDAVASELAETKEQLATSQGELISFKNDIAAMLIRVAELQGKKMSVSTAAINPESPQKVASTKLGPNGWTSAED